MHHATAPSIRIKLYLGIETQIPQSCKGRELTNLILHIAVQVVGEEAAPAAGG